MKLLIVTQKADKNDQNLGFFHRWIIEFAKYFDAVTVICLEEGEHELPPEVRVMSLGKEKGASRAARAMRFLRLIWSERRAYDVVFVHMNPEYIVLGGWLWKLLGKPIHLWYTHKSVTLKLRFAVGLVRRVFSASKESFRLKTPKLTVTGHAIDTEYFVPSTEVAPAGGPVRLITMGRISPVKCYESFIEALKKIRGSGTGAVLRIVGGPITPEDSAYLKRITEMADDPSLEGSVSFAGPVAPDDRLNELWQADVFVHASRTGSLDKTPLEAMAAGLIVVSSNDAMGPILRPFDLVFANDDVDDLVIKILRAKDLATSKDMRLCMRDFVVMHHSLTSVIGRVSMEMMAAAAHA